MVVAKVSLIEYYACAERQVAIGRSSLLERRVVMDVMDVVDDVDWTVHSVHEVHPVQKRDQVDSTKVDFSIFGKYAVFTRERRAIQHI